jgi:hypothetical protein
VLGGNSPSTGTCQTRRSLKVVKQQHSILVAGLSILSALLVLLAAGSGAAQQPADQTQNESPGPLQVRITKPLRWEGGCLSVSLDRVNLSSTPLFLPVMGLYISTSASEVGDETGKSDAVRWINVYGAGDLVTWDATSLASDAIAHDEHCLGPTVPVISLERKTRRQMPLRGKLRIDAYYFLTEKDWQENKSRHEEMMRTPPSQWDKISRNDSQVTTVFAAIPCREANCSSGCDSPPLILRGENRAVPDVGFGPDWKARGKTVSDELAKKSGACSEGDGAPE